MKKEYTWHYDKEPDIWNYGRFESIEECKKEAIMMFSAIKREVVYVGEVVPYKPYSLSLGDTILEHITEMARDECGEVAEEWRPDCAPESEIAILNERAKVVIDEWLKENNLLPNFYYVENVKEIRLTERNNE